MPLELPIFAQPKLGLWTGGRNGLVSVSLITHARSTDDEYATTSLIAITTTTAIPSATIILLAYRTMLLRMVSPPSGEALVVPMRYNDRALSNTPVTDFISAQVFLPATLCNRVAQVVRSVLWNAYYTPSNPAVSHNCGIQVVDSGCRAAIDTRSRMRELKNKCPDPSALCD